MENPRHSKPVIALKGNEELKFSTIGKAASALGLTRHQIYKALATGKAVDGYTFKEQAKQVPWGATYDWGPWLDFMQILAAKESNHIKGILGRQAREFVFDYVLEHAYKAKYPWGADKLLRQVAHYGLIEFWKHYYKLKEVYIEDNEWTQIEDKRKPSIIEQIPVHLKAIADYLLNKKSDSFIMKKLSLTIEEYNKLKQELGQWLLDNIDETN